jgi:hypothetical protein
MRLQGRILTRQSQAPAFMRMSGLNTSRGWTMVRFSEPVDTTLIPMSLCLASRPQMRNCSRSRPANNGRRMATAPSDVWTDSAAGMGSALPNQRDTISRDAIFPNRAHWPSTVRGTERAINGHVRLLLKLCSSPTLHQPRVGRNEGGGTGLSQRAGLEGRRPARRGPGRPVRCSPATGRTHWGLSSTQAGRYRGVSVRVGKE